MAGISAQHLVLPARRRRLTVVAAVAAAGAGVVALALVPVAPVAAAAVAIAAGVLAAAIAYAAWNLVGYRPALLVDGDGLHAGGRTVRWADVDAITSTPAAFVVATTKGQPLECPAATFTCPPAEVERVVQAWRAAFQSAAGEASSGAGGDPHPDRTITDEQWRTAAATQAPDAEWLAYGARDDEDPLHR
jgi:hypothetical protein